jgi:hypothetical protein
VTNAERAIVGVAAMTTIMAVIYLVRRVRAGDLDWRRDAAWIAGLIPIAVVIAALFTGPEVLVRLVVPGILLLGGAYLVTTRTDGASRRLGWMTIAIGFATEVLALIRIFVLR